MRHADPKIENKFLKQILEFEHRTASVIKQKVYHLLGEPEVKKLEELDDETVGIAVKRLTLLLFENNIEVLWGDERDHWVKYRFITEEIFEHEMQDPRKEDYPAGNRMGQVVAAKP